MPEAVLPLFIRKKGADKALFFIVSRKKEYYLRLSYSPFTVSVNAKVVLNERSHS
jgi:hypothetical protein